MEMRRVVGGGGEGKGGGGDRGGSRGREGRVGVRGEETGDEEEGDAQSRRRRSKPNSVGGAREATREPEEKSL
uniref:Uncharacterized protein n=1 Tax=Vespula pensylvanica TaxID=30213 RepID=A0A834U9T3_VESPE|nr:hypothetical protein H0235_007476 [Vespula pensylvanica]